MNNSLTLLYTIIIQITLFQYNESTVSSCLFCLDTPVEAVAVKRAYFGSFEYHPIHLDNVQCTGSEENITQCSYVTSTAINCDHSEDAGVICGGAYMYIYNL